jgi:hypothetical protein
MKLSILVPTLKQRSVFFNRLLDIVCPQLTDEVELVTECDSGELEIGTKRNLLVAKAKGDYVAFVDDDDRISKDYVSRILGAVKTNPDCVGIEGIYTYGRDKRKFMSSLRYKSWYEKGTELFRCPNHLNPVLRSIASKVPFPEKSWGEDMTYSIGIRPFLKTEVYLEGPIYFYDYNPSHFRRPSARHQPR